VTEFNIPDAELQKLRAEFAGLSSRMQNEIAMASVYAAAQIIVPAAAALAPSETGALRASIGVVLRRYPRAKRTLAVVGALRGLNHTEGREPANYAHLVEFGHRVAHKKTGKLKRAKIGENSDAPHGQIDAKPFLRPAWEAHKQIALDALKAEFYKRVDAAAGRAGKGERNGSEWAQFSPAAPFES
jgi:HK97 gp10 family phage protein